MHWLWDQFPVSSLFGLCLTPILSLHISCLGRLWLSSQWSSSQDTVGSIPSSCSYTSMQDNYPQFAPTVNATYSSLRQGYSKDSCSHVIHFLLMLLPLHKKNQTKQMQSFQRAPVCDTTKTQQCFCPFIFWGFILLWKLLEMFEVMQLQNWKIWYRSRLFKINIIISVQKLSILHFKVNIFHLRHTECSWK